MMSYSTVKEKELLEKEAGYIRRIREDNINPDQPAGLAISGGGIRSASFSLGALHALYNLELIGKFDYLSTVSGGGYIGACLSWFLNKIHHAPNPAYSLGHKDRAGARSADSNDVLDYLRLHGKYLTPGMGIDLVSALGVVLRSMFLGFMVYFPPLVAFFYLILLGCEKVDWLSKFSKPFIGFLGELPDACFAGSFLSLAFLLILCFAFVAIFYSIGTCFSDNSSAKPYLFRTWVQRWIGFVLKIMVLLVVVGTLPLVIKLLPKGVAPLLAGFTSLFSYLVAIGKLIQETKSGGGKDSKLKGIMEPLAALLLIYGLLLGGYLVAGQEDIIPWLCVAVILSVITAVVVNLNYVSLHRMYRDRLMEMFLPDLTAIEKCKWQPATEANSKGLMDFKINEKESEQKKFKGPFHIINTNLIQVDAENAKFRGRGGDSFILTPLYCGSNATDWCLTEHFNGGTMTLATAMAVSGAAVNPHAGPSGQGATRTWLVSFLLSFLNISLGFWVLNPGWGRIGMCAKPNYLSPGFMKGLLGRGFNEKSKFIELSDGGHFENLAVYELIRRRVKTIIIMDGGADLDFNFTDLANLVEKVRVDFGVEIDFSESEAPICDLLPGSGCEKSIYKKKYKLAKRGYASGIIKYPVTADKKALEGKIYYIKSTLTGGLPEDIYGYKSDHKDFPDQSTADQFFDEVQFEAYRELGYQLTKKMLEETGVLQSESGSGAKNCDGEKITSNAEELASKQNEPRAT